MKTKICHACKARQSVKFFYPDKRCGDGLNPSCKKCCVKRVTKWGKENPEKVRATKKKHGYKYHLKRKFGLDLEQYQQLFTKQGGCCAVCSKTSKRRLDVDHDHRTGKIRGLLCRNCNIALGYFKDNEILLDIASMYLRRSAA